MKSYQSFFPYILGVFAFVLYLFTAAPFMLWLDAPRFVAAIVSLGVPNPPEPLYILLAKPFTYLPFGSYIFRIQIFSALTAAIALVLLYRLVLFLTRKPLAALFGTAMLAFSYQFWSQAQNVETFILVTFLSVAVLMLAVTAQTKKKFLINFSIISAIMGLATGTNPVIASIIPTLLWVMWYNRKLLSITGFMVWTVIGVIAIIAIHLYIPIRANANPFLNYWRATTFEGVWNVSTGAGLNVFVPELGRINGFTGSPEIFFKSTWHFIEMWLIKFTPILLPFIILGGLYLWRKSRYYFTFWFLIVGTNWLFSALYFSGNQESWFLVSDIAWVVMAALGYLWLLTAPQEIIPKRFHNIYNRYKNYNRYIPYLGLLVLAPLVFWFTFLYRRDWVLTEDYIKNLYRPMEGQKAILFGSSDLYDSISFYVHDVPGTSVYNPNVVPITDNLLYILKWYRDNLKATTDLRIPDDSGLKYDSADEYSKYANEFFAQNIDKYKIYISVPAIRNNFLHVYNNQEDLTGSLKVDEKRFKLIPQGMLMQVVPNDADVRSDPKNFEFSFRNGFPKKKPWMLEQTYKTELTGVINEFAYSLENLGDLALRGSNIKDAFKFYQGAYDFNPKNAEIISRLGNYYGNIGDHAKAAEYFEKALKLEPNNIGLLFNSAIAYENTGRADKAVKNYNRVLQLSKGKSQIGQLAQTRLNAIKTASPSAGLATGSAQTSPQSIQQQLMTRPEPQTGVYQNQELNLQFLVPAGFKVTPEKGYLKLSNNLTGKDELSFWFYSRSMNVGEKLDNLGEKLPFEVSGPVLITQPITIPGFEAIGKTHGSGEHLTFLLLMKKARLPGGQANQGIAAKIYPGDSSKTEEFNQILGSIQTLR